MLCFFLRNPEELLDPALRLVVSAPLTDSTVCLLLGNLPVNGCSTSSFPLTPTNKGVPSKKTHPYLTFSLFCVSGFPYFPIRPRNILLVGVSCRNRTSKMDFGLCLGFPLEPLQKGKRHAHFSLTTKVFDLLVGPGLQGIRHPTCTRRTSWGTWTWASTLSSPWTCWCPVFTFFLYLPVAFRVALVGLEGKPSHIFFGPPSIFFGGWGERETCLLPIPKSPFLLFSSSRFG